MSCVWCAFDVNIKMFYLKKAQKNLPLSRYVNIKGCRGCCDPAVIFFVYFFSGRYFLWKVMLWTCYDFGRSVQSLTRLFEVIFIMLYPCYSNNRCHFCPNNSFNSFNSPLFVALETFLILLGRLGVFPSIHPCVGLALRVRVIDDLVLGRLQGLGLGLQ